MSTKHHCVSLHIFHTIRKKPSHSFQVFSIETKEAASVFTADFLVSLLLLFSFVLSSFS